MVNQCMENSNKIQLEFNKMINTVHSIQMLDINRSFQSSLLIVIPFISKTSRVIISYCRPIYFHCYCISVNTLVSSCFIRTVLTHGYFCYELSLSFMYIYYVVMHLSHID